MICSSAGIKTNMIYHEKGLRITAKVAKYLDNNFKENISIDELCNMFYCSKSTLEHCFKRDFGVSVKNYLKDRRLEEIKFWLRISDKPISQIATDNGFGTLPYFFRFFYKKEGMTPLEYRKINRVY